MAPPHPESYSAGNCIHQSHDDIGAQLVGDEASNSFDFDAWIQMDQFIDPPWASVTPDLDAGTAQRSFEPLEVHELGLDSFNGVQSFEVDNYNVLGGTEIVGFADSDTLAWNDSRLSPRVHDMEQDWPGVTNPDDKAPVDNSAEHQDGPIPCISVHTTLASASGIEMETVTTAEVHELAVNGCNAELLETPTLPLSKRTRISKQAKSVHQTHFRTNPYPNKEETLSLSKATELTGRTIKTWFTNTRSRIKAINGECSEPRNVGMSTETSQSKKDERSTRGVSRTSLEALERISPSGSASSLQRWLDTPANEDAVLSPTLLSPQISQALFQDCVSDLVVPRDDDSPQKPSLWMKSPVPDAKGVARSYKASSAASSRTSRASDSSSISRCSFRSVDARGPRRGRKAWRRSHSINPGVEEPESGSSEHDGEYPDPALDVKGKEMLSSTGDEVSRRYFCTFEDCQARFMFPFEWLRHEEALHCQPYHWICCLDTIASRPEILPLCWICGNSNVTANHFAVQHFSSCTKKEREDRLFFREDQLLQHINGVHLTTRVSKKVSQPLLSRWKIDNPAFDKNFLICGFCGHVSDTWQERHKHVSEHLRQGACKTACWPGGPSLANYGTVHINTDGPFECPHCGVWLENLRVASKEHSQCLSWSCRNLQDPHDVFMNRESSLGIYCRLCDSAILQSRMESQRLLEQMRHEESHNMCDCNQQVYTEADGFICHLESMHGAIRPIEFELKPWKLQLNLIWQPGAVYTLKTQRFVDPKLVFDENSDGFVCNH